MAARHLTLAHSTRQTPRPLAERHANIGEVERWATLIGGALLVATAVGRRRSAALPLALTGALLGYRALRGRSRVYDALGIRAPHGARGAVAGRLLAEPIAVRKAITIQRAPADTYRFWRRLENLPRFMAHLRSVTTTGERTSHWVAKAPAGLTVEWDAEITADEPDELIAWRSLEGSDVRNEGSVRFTPAPAGRGTEVRVSLVYAAVGGKLASAIARLFGEEPAQQIDADLRRLKQVLEAGEVPTGERRRR